MGVFFCGFGVNRQYLNEKVSWVDDVEESWSMIMIEHIRAMLGYNAPSGNMKVYWLLPGRNFLDGLRIISTPDEAFVMKQFAQRANSFVLYFDHRNHVARNSSVDDILVSPLRKLPDVLSPRRTDKLPHFYDNLDRSTGVDVEDNFSSDSSSEDEDDSDFVDSDNGIDQDDDDLYCDNVHDTMISRKDNRRAATSRAKGKRKEWDGVSSEEDLQLPESDEEAEVGRAMSSFKPEDMSNPIFKIGMRFPTVELLREAITEYSLKNRVQIKLPRNDRTRVSGHCAPGCPWMIYASFDSRVSCFLVKKYDGTHTCQRQWVLKKCTAKWLAAKYVERFRADEKMTLTNFARTVQLDWNLSPSRMKLSRARRIALQSIYGDEVQQYQKLWDYGHELRRSNPGSCLYLHLNNGCFTTLYMSLDACKRGFLSGCRPVICLDGCHIKTKFGGILLTAVGIDPNDCIFPIAVAVFEVESLASWQWFLETMKEDLGIDNTGPWTIMKDKQKGLIPAVQKVFPDAEHRFYVRHLYSNFQGHFKGENLKEQLWACARSCTMQKWQKNMEKMKALNKGAYDWLEKMAPNTWVKAFFSDYPKCDLLLNNSCEVFNNYILKARELPILTMLQRIKGQIMTRHYNKQKEAAEKWQDMQICPKIRKKIERSAEFANTCYVLPAGKGIFEVQDRDMKYNVDIMAKQCDCRRWNLTGIPCSHAISCLRHERIPQESVLPHCYSIEAFNQAYAFNIWPCNDQSKWEHVPGPEVKPPIYEKKVGRPTKARRKAPHEVQGRNGPKLSKHGVQMHCTYCKGTGHNIRACQRKKDGLPPTNNEPEQPENNEEPVITQLEEQVIPEQVSPYHEEYQGTLSQLSSSMVSQLMEESSQTRRKELSQEPLPDNSYIVANLPQAHGPATTTTKKLGNPKKHKQTATLAKKAPSSSKAEQSSKGRPMKAPTRLDL